MPILPGDHVVAGHGELVHQRCDPDPSGLGQRLAALLSERTERRFCHSCLVSLLGVSYDEARRAVAWLRSMRRVQVAVDPCSQCRASRVTVQTRDARAGDEVRARQAGA
jgi:hypothetical protein